MYTKHKLEFELTGCFMGFIRKVLSLIYNSLYSFNRKLMFAKNIRIEDMRGLRKAGFSPSIENSPHIVPDSETADTEIIAQESISNGTLFSNNVRNTSKQNWDSLLNSKIAESSIKNTKEVFMNPTNKMEDMYFKLYNINEQLERNLNKINILSENKTIRLDNINSNNNFKKQEMEQDVPNNETQNLVTNENINFNTMPKNDERGISKNSVLNELKEVRNETPRIIEGLDNQENFKGNKSHKFNNTKDNSNKKNYETKSKANYKIKILDDILHSQNEIPVPQEHYDKIIKEIIPANKYNFTEEQIKNITHRVKRYLIHLSESGGNQTKKTEFSSRQFSKESMLDSINSVILFFLGFTPEEESLAYFMSMVGTEMSGNLLRIGSGFNAMRQSELFSCMTNYGSIKFWNWVDSCCK